MSTATTSMAALPARPWLGFGEVRHARLRPAPNRFAYPTYFLLLPMRALRRQPHPALRRNRFGPISFHDRDHGDGGDDSLAWLDALLSREGIADAGGEVWLQCYPRVLGYAFKPVSFWYCERADGTLAAIVVEVNNTFGERHCYVLAGAHLAYGREVEAAKVLHVSPFCRVDGHYRFRFMRRLADDVRPPRIVARIDHHDRVGALLQTSLSGELRPLDGASTMHAFLGMPLMTLGVVARIHWQALKLFAKRIPWHPKPLPPAAGTSR